MTDTETKTNTPEACPPLTDVLASCRFDDEYIEKQLRSVAAMRGDGKTEDSLAYQAAECIARLRIAANCGGVVALEDVPDNELPGMWERSDFM